MKKELYKKKIDPRTFAQISSLFKQNGWSLDTENPLSLFNRFCERLSILENEEQQLVIELSKRFQIIVQQEYLKLFLDIFRFNENIRKSKITVSKKIYICPLISKNDIGKTKSSSFLWYYIKSTESKYNPIMNSKTFFFEESTSKLVQKVNDNDEAILLLVDDYIGSGETAESAVTYCVEQGINKEKIIILVLAAQKKAIELLELFGVSVYTNKILLRGINDFYKEEDLLKVIGIMQSIEKKLNVSCDFQFGYKQSEALISLNRTPNNTFPVFWMENKGCNIAPFPR